MTSAGVPRAAVLVTDAYWRKTVAAVRALGRGGVAVDAADPRRLAPAGFSRFCRRRWRCPDPRVDAASFAAWALSRLREGDYCLLLPAEEASCLALARAGAGHRGPGWIPLPPPAWLELSSDKLQALERASQAGVPTPDTLALDAGAALPRSGRWVVKPRRGTGACGVRQLSGGAEAGPLVEELQGRFGPLVLQRFVGGRRNGYGVSLLYGPDGAYRAGFVHRKIRELPVAGGVSTCAESVAWPELVGVARRYVEGGGRAEAIPWQGVINLEFKVDRGSGTAYLIEVNPRLWGALPLAVHAGVDFPVLMWRLARGESLDAPPGYRAGARLRWAVYGELAHAWQRLRRGDVPWDLLGEEAEGDFLWDRGDPGPFWLSLLAWGVSLSTPTGRAWLRR